MRNHTIAILGSAASFHDLAARSFFGEDISPTECNSFREVCDKIAANKADYGVIAIENKIAGSILLNYQLIDRYNLRIIGETFLPVELHLYAKKNTEMKNIRHIISHPMALGQCQFFLSTLENMQVSEFKDTSTCAKNVAEDPSNELAVIAGPATGKKYGLHALQENVCDEKENYTRFYIISKGQDYVPDADKASVSLQTANQPGKLCDVLLLFRKHHLNLTKIQSVPVPGTDETYAFHLDVEFEEKIKLEKAMVELHTLVKEAKVLGMYKRIQKNAEQKLILKKEIVYEN